jgi:hypothetical protein
VLKTCVSHRQGFIWAILGGEKGVGRDFCVAKMDKDFVDIKYFVIFAVINKKFIFTN